MSGAVLDEEVYRKGAEVAKGRGAGTMGFLEMNEAKCGGVAEFF
jgi:hypothetical protein